MALPGSIQAEGDNSDELGHCGYGDDERCGHSHSEVDDAFF
jgi:hypothetical protein